MKWDQIKALIIRDKIVITFGVLSSLFLLVGIETGAQTSFLLSEVSLSVVVTLVVVERIIQRDREQQWERVKVMTYRTMLNHLSWLAIEACFIDRYNVSQYEKTQVKVIAKGFKKPQARAATAMVELGRLIYKKYDDKSFSGYYSMSHKEESHILADNIMSFYEVINPKLQDIQSILIPRVLQLSNNQAVNEALLDFEENARTFEEYIRNMQKSGSISFTIAGWVIPNLLKKAGVLYDVLQYELQNKDEVS